jgi:hypothetical protein
LQVVLLINYASRLNGASDFEAGSETEAPHQKEARRTHILKRSGEAV